MTLQEIKSAIDTYETQNSTTLPFGIWSLPNTAAGLVVGLPAIILGSDISIGNNAIQFTNNPLMIFGALTLGNTIHYPSGFGPNTLVPEGTVGQHEAAHTIQGQQLGPLYIPSNILGLTAGSILDGDTHGPSNWNETGPQMSPPRPWP